MALGLATSRETEISLPTHKQMGPRTQLNACTHHLEPQRRRIPKRFNSNKMIFFKLKRWVCCKKWEIFTTEHFLRLSLVPGNILKFGKRWATATQLRQGSGGPFRRMNFQKSKPSDQTLSSAERLTGCALCFALTVFFMHALTGVAGKQTFLK